MIEKIKVFSFFMIVVFTAGVATSMMTTVFADDGQQFMIKIVPYEPADDIVGVPAIITTETGEYEVVLSGEIDAISALRAESENIKLDEPQQEEFEVTVGGKEVSEKFVIQVGEAEEESEEGRNGVILWGLAGMLLIFMIGCVCVTCRCF